MNFHVIGQTSQPLTEDDDTTNRRISIWQADECLGDHLENEAIIAKHLEFAESLGVPVAGERCQHEWDCCGGWYPGAIEVIHIDRIYGQVITQQIFRANV
eukprot:NODE_4465_length_347_cov_1.637584_g3862_i0.p2 GENE.NODE_4465_length_347_cov_1.637584_g3862_i0~~NODE_4465_length_347_cov_1.637584_g3862_i0.p2  ORF type:complete len:100 (+),score=13.21 NODE_4465_length_347_cov_1.637584_g3862_i0:27-326(+)